MPFDDTRIVEETEPLVMLDRQARLIARPAYAAMGLVTANPVLQVRRGILAALARAAASLPPALTLVVWDGLRSLATQAEIAELAIRDLNLSGSAFDISKFVATLPFSQAEFKQNPPAHATGGAVDVTLGDQAGEPLDLGCPFDCFGDRAALTYFETARSEPAKRCRDLRRTLYWPMRRAGFAPYAPEFWHFELGTRRAAAFFGNRNAAYGPAVEWINPRRLLCN